MYRRVAPRLLPPSRVFSKASASANILPPFRRHRTATSVLEALSKATGMSMVDQETSRDTYLMPRSPRNTRVVLDNKQNGREAAEFFLKQTPNLYAKFNFAEPPINAFRPTYGPDNVGEASETALNRLIAAMESVAAEAMYQQLTENGATPEAVSGATRLRLLELLAATNGMPITLRTSSRTIGQRFYPLFHARLQWSSESPAEKLFQSLPPEERSTAVYQAMIRGAVHFNMLPRAWELYEEMQKEKLRPDRLTFNALFKASAKPIDGETLWKTILRIYGDFLEAGHEPNTETFNSMLSALAIQWEKWPIKAEYFVLNSILAEMKNRGVQPNVGTMCQLLRLLAQDRNSSWLRVQILRIIDDLLSSPCRLEFNHVEDAYLVRRIVYAIPLIRNTGLLQKFGELVAKSPNLTYKSNMISPAMMMIFKRLEDIDAEAAMRFYKERVANQYLVYYTSKCEAIRLFSELEPDSVDLIMNDVLNAVVIQAAKDGNAKEVRPYLMLCKSLANLRPACHPALFRSVQHYWRLYLKRLPMPVIDACMLIAICLPHRNFESDVMEARTSLAWEFFSQMHVAEAAMEKKSSRKLYDSTLHLFYLALNLVKFQRLREAASVLEHCLGGTLRESEDRVSSALQQFNELLTSKELCDYLKEQHPELLVEAQKRSQHGIHITALPRESNQSIVINKKQINLTYVNKGLKKALRNEQMEQPDEQMERLEKQMERLEKQMERPEKQMEPPEKQMERPEKQMKRLEKQMEKLKKQIVRPVDPFGRIDAKGWFSENGQVGEDRKLKSLNKKRFTRKMSSSSTNSSDNE